MKEKDKLIGPYEPQSLFSAGRDIYRQTEKIREKTVVLYSKVLSQNSSEGSEK
jgi:hypothetical protein